jgi:hypothetical protein
LVLYVFGFERTAVVLSDLYFVDPHPMPGQESPEHGVRLEVRQLGAGELKGSIYSAQPIEIGELIWRADLLESVDGPPGSLDRAHHHPHFRGWNPGRRAFDPELTADPVRFVADQLADLDGLLGRAGVATDAVTAADAESLRGCLPEIMDAVGRLLAKAQQGEGAAAPDGAPAASARVGWL